MDTVASCQ